MVDNMKRKYFIYTIFVNVFISLFFIFTKNLYATDTQNTLNNQSAVNNQSELNNQNVLSDNVKNNNTKKNKDDNKKEKTKENVEESPFPRQIFSNIKAQVYNEDKKLDEILKNEAISILQKNINKLEKNFEGVVYLIDHSFDIGLSFLDANAKKYFDPTLKDIILNFTRKGLSLDARLGDKKNAVSRKVFYKYEKSKLLKTFLPLDNMRNGLFIMAPNFGEEKIQSVVLCPRMLVKKDDKDYELVDNNWKLYNILNNTYSNTSIAISVFTPSKISSYIKFSKDCNKSAIIKENQGTMVSVSASYMPNNPNDFEILIENVENFPKVLTMSSGVTFQKDEVANEAYKKIAYEIREDNLSKSIKFNFRSNNATVKEGVCYTIVGTVQ
ncbi:MAG: hypothetical protein ACOX3T_03755 [Bdellovibrionota bacterium]